ncbi:hypothetical protein QWY81_12210 [Polaribacter undariae]|uniref:Uncharacterized protein n=1 Tax=Polaribacter sejongensis TaxID=985043 RepID=A0AAJ1QY21_9FLAO|nr:hypothetical protein [Polaribacter undariae]MDN3620220.1 hypothetical protein [Polaribacter undariae]UWD32621.1 hypothetical protein NQP51_02860 [Polaribacter undariae]
MKNICISFIVLFISFAVNSQEKAASNRLFDLQKTKVEIDINNDVFTSVTTNMYVAQNPQALIVGLFIPISYENQKEKINSKPIAEGMEFKGEQMINSENVLLLTGTVLKKGIEFTKQKYYIKQDQNTCIELTTMLAVNADAKDKMMLMKIVHSVIENN